MLHSYGTVFLRNLYVPDLLLLAYADAAERFETWGLIFHSAMCIPLLKFSKNTLGVFSWHKQPLSSLQSHGLVCP